MIHTVPDLRHGYTVKKMLHSRIHSQEQGQCREIRCTILLLFSLTDSTYTLSIQYVLVQYNLFLTKIQLIHELAPLYLVQHKYFYFFL